MTLAVFAALSETKERDAYGVHVEIVGTREGLTALVAELQRVLDGPGEWEHTHLITETGGNGGPIVLSEVTPDKGQILVHHLDLRCAPDDWRGWTGRSGSKRR